MNYPREICSYFAGSKTLSVEAHFNRKEDDKPLEIFGDFSRFVFAIIQKGNEGREAINGNISIEELPYMRAATDYAMVKDLDNKYSSKSSGDSPAFTLRFAAGTLKGKTPVDVRLENGGDGLDILRSQYKFLKQNLKDYPNNQKLMDAITEASQLDLTGIEASSSIVPIDIFISGPRPWIRKTREDGKCLCYEIKIVWDSSRRYPINIKILNYYATVIKTDQGLLNVTEKDQESEKDFDINMAASSWLEVLRKMESVRDGFETINYSKAFKMSDEAFESNRTGNK